MPNAAEFVETHVPARFADLEFSYLRPGDFRSLELPAMLPDFSSPTAFYPLHLAIARHSLVLVSFGARPAFPRGVVQQWAELTARADRMEILGMAHGAIGPMPGVLLELRHASGRGLLRLRSAFVEDGGRLLNLSIIAPEAIWPGVEPTLQFALASFRLQEPRGGTVPLLASEYPEARYGMDRSA